ncbi:MAG: DUF3572 family protein [Microvirga sp.]
MSQVRRRTAMDVAQAILIFILLDQQRLSRFLATCGLTEAELRMGTTHRLALRVLKYVLDDDNLRDECLAAGIFMSQIEEAAQANGPERAPPANSIPLTSAFTLH